MSNSPTKPSATDIATAGAERSTSSRRWSLKRKPVVGNIRISEEDSERSSARKRIRRDCGAGGRSHLTKGRIMESPIQTMSIDTFVPMLRSLSKIFDKAMEHAKAKSFDGAVLANARLAPDMFPLTQQVQIACDMAKNGTARLMGKESPKF